MARVLITEQIHERGINFLNENGIDVELLYESKRPLKEAIKEADGVIVRLVRITEPLLKIGKRNKLKVVAKHGIGVDNINLEAARTLDIRVVNVPEVMSNAVAEFTIGSILFFSKKYMMYDSEIRKKRWKIRYHAKNIEIKGKTIGLIGYGHIGRKVASLLNCFGTKVVVYDPFVEIKEEYVDQLDLKLLLKSSDFISVHVPLTKATFHMIGRKEFEMMKDGIYIINTARGGVIDEAILYEFLKQGKVAGAVLDTTEEEPIKPNNPLLKLDKVIFTAHTAGITDVSEVKMSFLACKKIYDFLNGREPNHILV